MKKSLVAFLLTLAVVLTIPIPSNAYALYNQDHSFIIKLDKTKTMTYIVHADFSNTSFSHMNEALYQWRVATGYSLMQRSPTERHRLSNYGPTSSNDSVNRVYRVPMSNLSTIAENTRFADPSSHIIVESDINFNMNKKFANSAQPNCYDTYSIFLHESGHTIGLEDIRNPSVTERDSVMLQDWSNRTNSISWRTLRTDDKNGAKAIYQ